MNLLPNEQTQGEKIFYQDSNALVTQSRFTTGGKTYAMRNISSVTNIRVKKSKTLQIILIIAGIFMAFQEGNTRIYGIILLVLGIALLFLIKDDYAVKISSNSGESKALTSKDSNYVQKIVDALNEAIVFRG